MPGVPQSVSVTSPNSTSLMVTWDHPPAPDRNGVITNYTVKRQTGNEIITTELPSNDTSLLLTDLMPFTVYNITVAGSTSAGRGEFTTPVTRRTRIDSEWKMGLDNVCVCVCKCECCEGTRMVLVWFVTATAECIHSWHTVHVLTTHSNAYCDIVIVHWQLSTVFSHILMLNLMSSFFMHARTILSYVHTCMLSIAQCLGRICCAITYAKWTINV